MATELCSTCHGPFGVSVSPEFPNLAAQQPAYLIAQLKALRDHTRANKTSHDNMWGIAGPLDDAMITALANYFASQKPAPGKSSDPALIAAGKKIFDEGVAERGILACHACHGPAGKGAEGFPRLAGQNAAYVVRQLNVIQSAARAAPVMHGIVQNLTPSDMQAVAAYVQSL